MIFTEKENTLLKDTQKQEELCVQKYTQAAASAKDAQLRSIFTQIATDEAEHLSSITKLLDGTCPSVPANAPSKVIPKSQMHAAYDATGSAKDKEHDAYLCSDCLASEKHVSNVYNTEIFEFTNTDVRNVLNHIQTEEQEHGESLYNYMSINGMY